MPPNLLFQKYESYMQKKTLTASIVLDTADTKNKAGPTTV